MGEISVELIADIGRLRTGLNQGIALINKFSQQATRGAQTVGTGFQQTAKQVGVGARFMGSEYNRFAVGAQKTSAQVSKAVQTQTTRVKEAAKGVGEMGTTMRKTKPKMDEFTGGILAITRHLGKWIAFNLSWFLTWRLMWTALRWLKAGVAAIVDFDTAITALGAVTAATQEQLLTLEDTARDVGATTRFTAVEVAEAMVDLSKAGFSVSEVNQMISGTALLAIGTLSDLTQTTQLVAVTLRTFHLQAAEAAMVANVFAAAITSSRLTIDSLRSSIKYIGPIMAEMDYTIQDTAAVLGVLADRGLEAGISARGLRGFFSALVAPTVKLRKELNRVGLSVRDVSPLTNDLAIILRRLEEANFDVESAMRGLERRVGTTAIALISAGKYFDVLRDAITATTAAQVIADRQVTSLGYRLILLRSQATEVALDFRDLFLPSIQGVLGGISALLVAINELTSRIVEVLNVLPPWARQLTIIAGLLIMITTAVGIFSSGLGKGVGLIGLFTAGAGLMYGKIIAGAKAFGIWGLAITGIIIGFTYLISKIRAAREETTRHRKEVAASVFDLGKQRTELARLAIMLGEYRDDEIKLRTALEGLADTYPEIRRLLMIETVTYEAAIKVVNELLESKTKEAKVRRVDLIEAIKAEIETRKEEIESLESLQERIKKTWPVLRIFLYIWMLIKHGTLDAGKALSELDKKIRDLELSLRAMEPPTRKAAETIEKYRGPLRKAAKDALDLAKAQGIIGRELIKYIDAAIGELREFRDVQAENLRDAVAYFYHYNKKLLEGRSAQEKWTEALSDPKVEEAYKAWLKAEKGLVSLHKDRREIMEKLYDSLKSLRDAEEKLWDLRMKRAISEETYLERTLSIMQQKMFFLRQSAEEEGKWTKKNAEEYIKTQQAGFEAFTKLLDLKLQAALTAGKTEQQAIEEVQATWNLWTPYFRKFAADYFEIIESLKKVDRAWVEDFKRRFEDFLDIQRTIVVKGMAPLWIGELKKIKKAYIEYQRAMLEFDVAVRREKLEVQIEFLKELFLNEEYWQGKEFTARLAIEKELVSLYQKGNAEIIKQAKELAKTDIALALGALEKRRMVLQKEIDLYPILGKEIVEARKAILTDVDKMIRESHKEYVTVTADTIDEVLAVSVLEYDEKVKLLENLLKNAKLTAKEREEYEKALGELREIRGRKEFEVLLKIQKEFMEEYVAIDEARLEELEINSREAYMKALREEKKRFEGAEKRLIETSRENVLVFQRFDSLRERLRKIHVYNLAQIDGEWAFQVMKINFEIATETAKLEGKTTEVAKAELNKRLIAWYNQGAALEVLWKYRTEWEKAEWRKRAKVQMKYLREMNIATLDAEIKLQQKLIEATQEGTTERMAAQAELYGMLKDKEKLLIEDLVKRGRMNDEIQRKVAEIWASHYLELGWSAEQTAEFIIKNWKTVAEEMDLVADTIEGRWDILLTRLKNRIQTFFTDIQPWLRDLGELIARTFETTIQGIINALTNLFDYWWRGGDRATRFTRDQAQKRLDYIRRELEEEERLHGQYTDRYKELVNEQARAHAELAEAEFALLQERQAVWREFINALIKEIIRLIVQMLVALAIKMLLLALGIPVGGGGPVPAEAGGEVAPAMKKGGLIKKLRKRLQDLQKGGEVLVRAHEGEYVIPEPVVTRIKRTREVPEELVEGIVAGKPPSFQRGGEIGIAERAPATLIVNFQPGTTFTELEKTQARQYFERTWLPLWREAQRREQVARW